MGFLDCFKIGVSLGGRPRDELVLGMHVGSEPRPFWTTADLRVLPRTNTAVSDSRSWTSALSPVSTPLKHTYR
jgi:hypothetical protein